MTARAARWSAAHWKTATVLWLAFVAAAVVLGGMSGKKSLSEAESSNGDTARAETILAQAGFRSPAGESVLVQARHAGTPLAAETGQVVAALRARPELTHVRHTRTSADGRSALVEFDVRGDPTTAGDRIGPALSAVSHLQSQTKAFTVAEFGSASIDKQVGDQVDKDLSKAEKMSIPITLAILLVAFGAFVAAGIPVLLALSAVLAAMGLDQISSHIWHTTDTAASVILLVGMAVGVDYSLFYVKREREERRRGHGDDALIRAASSSGMAVLVSGATVMIAMAGMLLSGSRIFTALGISAMLVVAVAVVGSLTVLPALLGRFGGWMGRKRTLIQRVKGDRESSRVWDVVLRVVLRRPWLAAAAAVWVLVLMALPALSIHTALPGIGDLSRKIPAAVAYDRIDKAFPGSQIPLTLVVKAKDVRSPQVKGAIAELRKDAVATHLMDEPVSVHVNPAQTVARIDLPLRGNGSDPSSTRALSVLRNSIVPKTVGTLPGVAAYVTGETAGDADFNTTMKHRFPYVFAFVLGLAFLLLLLTFRSVVVPLTAIVLNLLSVTAAYGALVWIFQDGHLQGLLGFHSNGAVVTWLPLFLFAILFALSMDYHVFIVSRIKELVDRGVPNSEAVSEGIRSTAGTVTSAAVVMVAVFALFASLSTLEIKQMGVGLAVAVLLDATIIRGVLLPATMKLLGNANWYLPRSLHWLPRVRLAEAAA
ncbi:MAG TPA: MMPL family transporter [Gaiellaceae bacterium]|nr:MMPL family transporter [Gaiellaceae bacterium]